MSRLVSSLRQELVTSIYQELKGVGNLWDAINCCLTIMTDAQLGEFRMALARGLPQTVSTGVFTALTNEIIRLIREAGKHLSDEEYQEFVHDVLSKVEYSETP